MNFICLASLKDIKSYQIIIYRNHAVGPKESGKSCRAVKPTAFSSSCAKSLRSDPCTSAKAASMSCAGWPALIKSSELQPGMTKETPKGYKMNKRAKSGELYIVWFKSFVRSLSARHGVTSFCSKKSIAASPSGHFTSFRDACGKKVVNDRLGIIVVSQRSDVTLFHESLAWLSLRTSCFTILWLMKCLHTEIEGRCRKINLLTYLNCKYLHKVDADVDEDADADADQSFQFY